MRRRATLLAIALVALLATAPAAARAPTRIGVTGLDTPDMALLLSASAHPKAEPGPAEVQFHNAGEDAHDLVIRRRGARAKHRYPELAPGATHELELRLRRASRYDLWCTLPTHRDQGMAAVLRVRGS